MTTKHYIQLILVFVALLFNTNNASVYAAGGLQINFYGQVLSFSIPADFLMDATKEIPNPTDSLRIKQFEAQPELLQFVKESNKYKHELRLDDLGYLQLVKKCSERLGKKTPQIFQTIFTYSVLNNNGYNLILGVGEHGLTLYGLTNFGIKNCLFVEQSGKKYYDLSFNAKAEPQAETILIRSHVAPSKIINLNKLSPPALSGEVIHKTFPFEYDGNVYFFSVTLNNHLVKYYRELPDIEFGQVYLNYGLTERGPKTLINQLTEATAYMSKENGIKFILGFIQSLPYAMDKEVWGQEKFSFPEEALANDFTDCEDRSILFAFLVREVLHLQTIGLYYQQATHMNVAVENWRGKNRADISAYNMDFIICEPSAKGVPAGTRIIDVSLADIVKW